jgi:hypothetical protein
MSRRDLFIAVAFGIGLVAGNLLSGSENPSSFVGPTPAFAGPGNVIMLGDSQFLTTWESSAYLWSWDGARLSLDGQCARVDEGSTEQAQYVWLPGVERGP